MQESRSNRRWNSIQVPQNEFQDRMKQLVQVAGAGQHVSMLSRYALIHKVAKTYALEALKYVKDAPVEVTIEEITDPPLYDLDIEDGVVIIQYSYEEAEQG